MRAFASQPILLFLRRGGMTMLLMFAAMSNAQTNQWCQPNPCSNGGTPVLNANILNCICPSGYSGAKCTVSVCDSSPCTNGGTCSVSSSGTWTCACASGWTGATCGTAVTNPCSPNPCQNGGACAVSGSTFTCTCTSGWIGATCGTSASSTACSPNPCRNNGACTPTGATTYTCACMLGFSGSRCETTVCFPNPCSSGQTCTVSPTGTAKCSTAGSCTANCDRTVGGANVVFCGSDGVTHTTTTDSLNNDDNYCYAHCFVSASYPGACGCPNNCNSDTGRGTCSNGQCSCNAGWTGLDCSLVTCPGNTCSGHGTCSRDANGDYCACSAGWTGHDCATAVPAAYKLKSVPYGTLFPNEPYWTSQINTLGDANPLFTLSALANFYIQISWPDYLSLMDARSMWNGTAKNALSAVFDNGVVRTNLLSTGGVTINTRGQYTQMEMKKGFNIKLKNALMGIKTFSLKTSFGGSAMLNNILFQDFLRTLGHPSQRMAYAALWINGVFFGGYAMQEQVARSFLREHWPSTASEGNLYGIHGHALTYWSSRASSYANARTGGIEGFGAQSDQPLIELEEEAKYPTGTTPPPSHTDYAAFVAWLNNQATSADFAPGGAIESWFNVQQFHRGTICETFFRTNDNWLSAKSNFLLYNERIHPASPRFTFLEYDYDLHSGSSISTNVYTNLLMQGSASPLTSKLYANTARKNEWTALYRALLDRVFPTTGQPADQPTPAERHLARLAILQNAMNMDKWYTFIHGGNGASFASSATRAANALAARAVAVRSQLG